MPSNAQWAINLPNQFAPIGEVLSQGLAMKQRQNAQLADIYKDRQKQHEQDVNANLSELQRQTGEIEKTKTINEGINATTHNAINDIYTKYSQIAKTMKPADYSASLMNDLAQLSNWHQSATTAGDRMIKEHQEILKQNPSLDASKLLDTGANNFANRFIDPNTKQLIPPERINQNQSFFHNLDNPDELAAHTATTEGIGKFFKDLDKTPFSEKAKADRKGFINAHNYKGVDLGDIQQREYDEDGHLVANPLKYEKSDIKDASGQPLRMITPELEKAMKGNGLEGQMHKLWMDNKEPEIINWALQNHKSPKDLTPEVLDQLKKSFLYKNFSQYVNSKVSSEEITATPRDRVSNTFIFGNGQGAFNPQTSGTEFDRIGDLQPLNIKGGRGSISKGVVHDKDGNPYSGEITIPTNDIPAGLKTVMKPSLNKEEQDAEYFHVKVENGRIEAVKPSTEGSSWVDRQDAYNLQLQNNAEPIKAPQKVYGNPKSSKAPAKQSAASKPKTYQGIGADGKPIYR